MSDALEACAREGADASLRHAPTLWAHLDGGALAAAGGRAQTRAHTAYMRALGAGGRWEEAVEMLGALEAAGGGAEGGGGGGGGSHMPQTCQLWTVPCAGVYASSFQ